MDLLMTPTTYHAYLLGYGGQVSEVLLVQEGEDNAAAQVWGGAR